ncbi:TPA: hypothetical protein ACGVBR_004500, partial [Vibrio vulnificus]
SSTPGKYRMDLAKTVQVALLGEVPHTLRYLYTAFDDSALWYYAVFTDDAEEEHLECANVVLTEILSHFTRDVELKVTIKRDSQEPWRINSGEGLMYLRYGELE